MSWPADTLAGVFLFLFAFGFVFSLASLLLGAGHGHVHLPGHGHVGPGHAGGHGHFGHGHDSGHAPTSHSHGGHAQAGHAPGKGDGRAGAPAPLNLSTILIFCAWFGAAGYALRAYSGATAGTSLLAATIAGTLGAALLYLFLARVLWRGQTALDPANYLLDGTPATVTQPIRPGGTGEIIYTLDDKRRVDGARAVDGAAIPAGAPVAIRRYEGGLAYVEPADPLDDAGPFQGRPVEPVTSPPRRGRG